MLLTKKTGGTQAAPRSPFVHSLQRGLSAALPTMDRRAEAGAAQEGAPASASASASPPPRSRW
jgi:formate dehydrogenase major subunit